MNVFTAVVRLGNDPEQRIAQIVIAPVVRVELVETDLMAETERGEGGFGSTGSH